eukprot:CAMPEP_0173309032 /NCGR_PEP_ID=MMETSP1143-20121109/22084_1 /TAXON_ID=483371 /ORGANISM="non described non described, Strain CCMP2298" /LENGTH=60 /DNA_ID=CAMNT_0014250537 /DNA_START=21 /DNA_END=200 /DNA_ORIENTATION=-
MSPRGLVRALLGGVETAPLYTRTAQAKLSLPAVRVRVCGVCGDALHGEVLLHLAPHALRP